MKHLEKNKELDFIPEKFESEIIYGEDKEYMSFLKIHNGGYFYGNSLHIFGESKNHNYHDIIYLNSLYSRFYGELTKGIIFFAEDILGNIYGFHNEGVAYFNIETSDYEIICKDFKSWIKEINNDLSYYTGKDFLLDLPKEDKISLALGKRLGAKYPFVLGGDYETSNFILKDFEENIEYNSSIAKQIVNLPDGTPIKIDIK
ncbi:SMI1/KNR4 family protein [Tenacibaculum discolor]|uniref:SMI1/KNR4 family protein n=1 Tax=Tenacibaculum discolor TaxID=361581 RepID=UPI000EB2E786|nr:SMI1/KNR4 family protein [Tenacibaculum discolor]RLJ99620.1 SUKH superfamily protein [Tenacibaculum discolor]